MPSAGRNAGLETMQKPGRLSGLENAYFWRYSPKGGFFIFNWSPDTAMTVNLTDDSW